MLQLSKFLRKLTVREGDILIIEVITLGGFSIKINGKTVSENTGRTKKLWKLLNLLILNRNKPLTIQNIIDSIFVNEDVEASTKAIYNLIFRLKRIFADDNKSAKYIVFSTNGYMLNIDGNFKVDIHIMEDCYEAATASDSSEYERIVCYEKIIELYNGEYLPNLVDDLWKITATSHFDYIFVNTVVALSELYLERNEYEKLFQVCDKAMMLKPIEESIYICMIKGMMQTAQTTRAINLCDKYFNILYKEMGINVSEQMQAIYAELKRGNNTPPHEQNPLTEFNGGESVDTAFFCNSKTFNDIYKHELRQIERNGKNKALLLMVGINKKDGSIPSGNALFEAKRQLYESCLNTMRKGDIFANYSKHQYIILLGNVKYESHNEISKRLKKHFYQNCGRKDVFLNFKSKALTTDSPDIIDFADNIPIILK